MPQYKLPSSAIDVKALAGVLVYYNSIYAQDTQYLSEYPVERDRQLKQFYATTPCKPSIWPADLVGTESTPQQIDEYLSTVDSAIKTLSPPKTIEDRIKRAHLAMSAFMVFTEFKVNRATNDDDERFKAITVLATQQACEWQAANLPKMFESYNSPKYNPLAAAPGLALTTDDDGSWSAVDQEDFLEHPHKMLRKVFKCTPPQNEDEDFRGEWKLLKYVTQVREDDELEHEFEVSLGGLGGIMVPLDTEEMTYLLQYSKVASSGSTSA